MLPDRARPGALSAAALTSLAACGRDAGAPDPNASSDLEGRIRGAGATSQSDAQDAWMNAFMSANLRAPSTTPAAAPGPDAPSSSRAPSTSPAPTPP